MTAEGPCSGLRAQQWEGAGGTLTETPMVAVMVWSGRQGAAGRGSRVHTARPVGTLLEGGDPGETQTT